jgi:hypothetical protein
VKGFVFGQQKSIALFNCTGDWAFYLEADEVLHENDLPKIRAAMEKHLGDERVEALAFDYLHFYGNKNTIAWSPGWYRSEVRIIRNTIPAWSSEGAVFQRAGRPQKIALPARGAHGRDGFSLRLGAERRHADGSQIRDGAQILGRQTGRSRWTTRKLIRHAEIIHRHASESCAGLAAESGRNFSSRSEPSTDFARKKTSLHAKIGKMVRFSIQQETLPACSLKAAARYYICQTR